jgi:hypothetical protein
MPPIPIEQRFWTKVQRAGPDECWLWTASVTGSGYGQIWESWPVRIRWDAHKYSWILHFGPVPDGLWVLHTCDVKRCVNPKHLYLGTNSRNLQDALERGQKAIGSQCSFAKLCPDEVQEIRRLKQTGLTQEVLADQFGVSKTTIWRAYSGRAYKDIAFVG